MHAHELLRWRLVDLESHLYRSDQMAAIAGIEADGLSHDCVYLHPDLVGTDAGERLQQLIMQRKCRRVRVERRWQMVGKLALGLLLIGLIGLL